MKICPKCGYQRTKGDDIHPDYECPKCKVIYAKAKQGHQLPNKNKNSFFEKWKTSYHNWKASCQKQDASFQKQIDITKAKASENVGLCPRCRSNRTCRIDGKSYQVMGGLVIFVSLGMSLIFLPLGGLGIIAGIGLMMMSSFIKESYNCKDCQLSWKPGENPFPETKD